ncbi:hypothetical protein NE686_17765 [Tissierella carlieri]|uniref:Cyclic GMP-AMP synthase n=1 Tax=Tissierella carlieri TaxID=689904 RepID=A0ABT1SF06_9FIRM|nr:hypothetical protein [Tissierella carlieri]MCQ4924952.1 hypothetical protein [Tissierella carlieri]
MCNLHEQFGDFHDNISLSNTKKEDLRRGRDALRQKVRNYFKEKDMKIPDFCGQGSFMMKTVVNPIGDNEYDIDDGIYLKGYQDTDEDWPATSTVHSWIKKAVENHTSEPPQDKNTCIRVIYAKNYHIDLPSYIIKDDVAYLAHKAKGWIESDPKAMTDWFINENKDTGDQLRRVVKYIKAWKDYQNKDSKQVDLCGLAITILAANNFYYESGRDDKSLLGTLTSIIDELESDFVCNKPVTPKDEDLFEGFSSTKQTNILSKLKSFRDTLEAAIDEDNEKKACEKLRGKLGERFPEGEDNSTDDEFVKSSGPTIIRSDGRSA